MSAVTQTCSLRFVNHKSLTAYKLYKADMKKVVWALDYTHCPYSILDLTQGGAHLILSDAGQTLQLDKKITTEFADALQAERPDLDEIRFENKYYPNLYDYYIFERSFNVWQPEKVKKFTMMDVCNMPISHSDPVRIRLLPFT